MFAPEGYNFNDFDLLVENDTLFTLYVKKVPYPIRDPDSREPNRYGLAKSADGLSWQEVGDTLLPTPNSWEESLWAGCISKQDGAYVAYYTGTTMHGRNDACQIGKAYSKDLIHWQKDAANPVFSFDRDNPYYSSEPGLAFRDPFFFEHEGKRYLIFCAKDKSKPTGKQGCVGIVEEERPNQFRWMPPLFSPGTYFDGLECPALYKIEDRWYLFYGLDAENKEDTFRYAIADKPFGPFNAPTDNQLVPAGGYACRMVKFKGKLLLYYWLGDIYQGKVRQRLAPPKEVRIGSDGRILLSDILTI